MTTTIKRWLFAVATIALSGGAISQNIDGRISGFANNNNKVIVPKGGSPVLDLRQIEPGRVDKRLLEFRKEVDSEIRSRADFNVAWLFWRDGVLIHEAYHPKVKPDNYFLGFSVTKSLIAMAYGHAFCEGKLAPGDLAVKYVPQLSDSAYANRTIESLLLMKSGVPFDEYESENAARVFRSVLSQSDTYDSIFLKMRERDFPAKASPNWNYDTNNTEMLGRVLHAVSGGLDGYLSQAVWSKIGAQADAWFVVDKEKRLLAGSGLYAQPRDFLRLGIHALGLVSGENASPCLRSYMGKAVSPLSVTTRQASFGYGYQFWSRNKWVSNNDGVFEMKGHLGQRVIVGPKTRAVAVALSVGDGELDRFYSLFKRLRELPMQ